MHTVTCEDADAAQRIYNESMSICVLHFTQNCQLKEQFIALSIAFLDTNSSRQLLEMINVISFIASPKLWLTSAI